MGAFDATTSVTDGVTDNLAQYHNELKTAADHAMSAAAYAAYGTPASMTGNVTLTDASLPILSYAPTAARDLTLPAVATTNHAFYVINRSGTYAITVKDASTATITTVAINSTAFLVSDGANSWYPMGGALSKAAASDVTTGTDDAKYVTSKAIKDSVNVPNVAPSTSGNVLTSNGTAWTSAAAGGSSKFACNGRLTLETGVAISTTEQTAKTTLYLTKYNGDQIATYSGTAWVTIALGADISITLAGLTAGLPYDVYVYSNAGTLTLELTAWTNTTTRATALTTQDGVYVKTGATTRRYIGTIRIAATGQCELVFGGSDKASSIGIWNMYNRVSIAVSNWQSSSSWTYQSTTFRKINNNDYNMIKYIVGVVEDVIDTTYFVGVTTGASSGFAQVSIGLDSQTVASTVKPYVQANSTNGYLTPIYKFGSSVGYHYLQALENATTDSATTFNGTSGAALAYQVFSGTLRY